MVMGMRKPTMMSLFDGSGGFPLAASMCGIVPVAASEVEPYPIAVTRSRFPNMKHLGSVTDVKGYEVDPVDVITFGSPCQDLSVAGKRAGLKHEENGDDETTRSGLFMEAVRIIKEMRRATNGVYPRFAVWENVPGAFSSNKGEDFRTVCEELIKIVEPAAVMPAVPKNGWPYADCYCGEGWSLAYRVFDAQYWGVPQRRRRIYLVVDFRGECAGKVLFEREGLRGYFAEGRTPWQGAAADAENCIGADDREGEVADRSDSGGEIPNAENLRGTGADGSRWDDRCVPAGCGGDRGCVAFNLLQDPIPNDKVSPCMGQGNSDGGQASIGVVVAIDQQGGKGGANYAIDVMPTICSDSHGTPHAVAYSFDSLASNSMKSSNPHSGCRQVEVVVYNGENITSPLNKTNPQSGDPCHTLGTDSRNYLVECVCCIDGDKMYTLTAKDASQHAVAYGISSYDSNSMKSSNPHSGIYVADTSRTLDLNGGNPACNQGGIAIVEPVVAFQTYQKVTGPLMANSHPGSYTGQDAFNDMLVEGVDCRNGTETPEKNGTLQAKPGGGTSLNYNQVVRVRYIVRRLTPTECARLQGFADRWAVPDRKDDFTDEEYHFWLDVRNTHAAINGKAVKDYTKEQMLKWYNNLRTDSSEYKLWGNGIAFPNALYVMQGISDVINQ